MSNPKYLSEITTKEQAYCLGFFAYIYESHTYYSKNCYELKNIDKNNNEPLFDIFQNFSDIIYDDDFKVSFTVENHVISDILTNIKNFNNFSDNFKKEFIRGLYEYNNIAFYSDDSDILFKQTKYLEPIFTEILEFMKIPYIINEGIITIKHGCSSCDFLGFIYTNINNDYSFDICNYNRTIPRCCVIKTDIDAILPSKVNGSDVGFDLCIIKKVKDFNSKTALYDTGIKIQLDFGYYAEIVPRSSISKTGYILANNIGIIDNSYRGNLMIALTKIADDAIDFEFPFKCCQLIIRKQVYANIEEVVSLYSTKRSDGGFGSTDLL